jgi:hypothetical protein
MGEFRDRFLFGLVDGINGAVGLVIGLLRSHAAAQIILVGLLARAGSSGVSMAGAQYESDDTGDPRRLVFGRVAAMGAGYLCSALLPGLGFALGIRVGLIIFIPATLLILATITWFRSRHERLRVATATTLVIFGLAVLTGFLASLVA